MSFVFAPTPPLEALRIVLSFATTTIGSWKPCYDGKSDRCMQTGFLNISCAYFNAKIDADVPTYDKTAERLSETLVREVSLRRNCRVSKTCDNCDHC